MMEIKRRGFMGALGALFAGSSTTPSDETVIETVKEYLPTQRVEDQFVISQWDRMTTNLTSEDPVDLIALKAIHRVMVWDVMFAIYRSNFQGVLCIISGCPEWVNGYTDDGECLPGCDNESLQRLRQEDPLFHLIVDRLVECAMSYRNLV